MSKTFSILQGAYLIAYARPNDDPDTRRPPLTLQFGEDPHNSAIVRLRIVPPGAHRDDNEAIEIEFNRNGELISQQLQPTAFVAWDRRPVEVQQAEADKRRELANTASEVQNSDVVDENPKTTRSGDAGGKINQPKPATDKVNTAADLQGGAA